MPTYNSSAKVHHPDPDNLVIESGGTVTVKSGGTATFASGSTTTFASGSKLVMTDSTLTLPAGGITLGNISFTGLKALAADGVDSSSAAADITLTGAVIGQRLILSIGQLKSETAANSFVVKLPGTDFESIVTQTDKLVQAKAAGNLSAHTFLFLFAPAAAAE